MNARYWHGLHRKRVSRRRFLGGAVVAGLGTAGLAAVGCAEEEEEAAGPTPAVTPPALEPVRTRGGFYRAFGYDSMPLDTRDPHQSRFGPIWNTQSAIFSNVLNYDDVYEQIMRPDLSAAPDGGPGMPEQPDDETYIIRVRPTARFHDTPEIRKNFPQVAGRAVTAEDVKYSIERQINPDSPQAAMYYHREQWEVVDKIELIDDLTLKITTRGPVAPFLHYLADRNYAAIVARELVDENDEINEDRRIVGSGPFILDKLQALQVVRMVRNPAWFAAADRPDLGTGRPLLDGYEILWTPESDSVQETAFRTRQIDSVGFSDHANVWRLAEQLPQTYVTEGGITGGLASSILIDRPPYQDLRVRQAINMAMDRVTLGEQMFPSPPEHPSFRLTGSVPWPCTRWALPQEELLKRPGYRFGPGEREEDLTEAKKLWEAAGGSEAIGPIKILFSGLPAVIPQKVVPQLKRMLTEILGAKVETVVDPTGYTQIIACLKQTMKGFHTGECDFTVSYDNGYIDLDDWVYPTNKTGGSRNSSLLSDSHMDDLLEAQRAEFDYERRRQIGFDIHNYAGEILAGYRYVNDIGRNVRWPYVKNTREFAWFGHAYWYANLWLDHDDPEFAGRPA